MRWVCEKKKGKIERQIDRERKIATTRQIDLKERKGKNKCEKEKRMKDR